MATDPSWLYSTIAQSSAAIVAIVGGFITASVLMLSAEKRGLKNQLNDKNLRLAKLTEHGDPTIIQGTTKQGEKIEIKTRPVSQEAKEVSSLKTEISDLETRLEAFSYPPNLERGLMILGYLAVFGILLPIFIIANNAFSVWAKILTTVTFSLGIIGVFAFVVFQIQELRRK